MENTSQVTTHGTPELWALTEPQYCTTAAPVQGLGGGESGTALLPGPGHTPKPLVQAQEG